MASPNDLLVDYNYPLAVVNKNANKNLDTRSKERIWYSQPRVDTSNVWEVLRIALRTPIMINHLSFGILNRSCYYEVWVTTATGRAKLLDGDLRPVQGFVTGSTASTVGWKTIVNGINPTIISKIEIKIRRNSAVGTGQLISLGIRDFLMKRTIKTQADTLYSLGTDVDIMGNPIRRTVREWGPELAIDSDAFSFWKSGPQPSPEAVVNFYTTVGDGTVPVRVDRIWIDPVYSGQNLNLYYSTDPTVGTVFPMSRKVDATLTNTEIKPTKGVDLSAVSKSYVINTTNILSRAGIPLNLIGSEGWIGGEFEVAEGLSGTVTIFDNPGAVDWSLKFNYATKIFTFMNNFYGHVNSKVISNAVPSAVGDRIQWIITFSKNLETNEVTLRLILAVSGVIVSDTNTVSVNNETMWSIFEATSTMRFATKFGYLRNLIIKVAADNEERYQSFIVDPDSFLRPSFESTQPKTYVIQSSLDNAVLVGAYTTGEGAYGGLGQEFYEEKMWTPVWKDWTVQRGYYDLPAPIAACHLKLEFSKLTEQPYPIYESGIEVPYKVFPTYAIAASASNIVESIDVASAGYENLKPNASSPVRTYSPKTSIVFGSLVVDNIRNRYGYNHTTLVNEQLQVSSVKTSTANNPMKLASAMIRVNDLNNAEFSPTAAHAPVSTSLGVRTPAWWYLPNGLKISADTMSQITQNSTQTERSSSSSETNTLRTRFTTQSVHRYETRYAKRDVGLAYFAGIRGFQAFAINKTVPVDSDEYTVINYAGETSSADNLFLGVPGAQSGSYPIDIPDGVEDALARATFSTWDSIGTYVKTKITTVDRGLHSDTKGSDIEPLGLDNSGGFWDDDQATWDDTVNVWGASSALVGLDFQSNLFFSGREAVKIYRVPGFGSAGVRTRILDMIKNERVRLVVSVYRPISTSNTFVLQLEDTTPITGTVLFEENVSITPGRWNTLKTNYFKMPNTKSSLRVNFLIDGVQEETLYLSDLYEESTTMIYSLSNDGGATYYEATEVLNEPDKYLVFPTPGNHLKVKVEMYDPRDYGYGFTVKPYYLF